MNQGTIHFSNELNYFLSKSNKFQDILYLINDNQSIKHLVEALGVPHTEIGIVVINNIETELSHLIQDGDRIEVLSNYPAEASEEKLSQEQSSIEKRGFLLDNHLGKLATYLRLCGFDVQYRNDYQDIDLVEEEASSGRILLTRDRGLVMYRSIQKGYCIRSLDPKEQTIEVLERYNLFAKIQPFRRCLRCNALLEPVEKDSILDRLRPLTRLYYEEFHICARCDQIYWKGSHYERMTKFIKEIKES